MSSRASGRSFHHQLLITVTFITSFNIDSSHLAPFYVRTHVFLTTHLLFLGIKPPYNLYLNGDRGDASQWTDQAFSGALDIRSVVLL